MTGLLAKDDRRNMLLARLVTSLVREGRYVLVISAPGAGTFNVTRPAAPS